MQLSTLLNHISVRSISNPQEIDVRHITHDSRQAKEFSIFVAICGERFDARRFIDSCEAQVIVTDRPPLQPTQKTIVLVDDARRAMANIACELFAHPSRQMNMVGITGTNGKTTTSWMLYHILRNAGQNVGVIGTLGHHLNGIPLPIQDGHTTPESSHLQSLLKELVEKDCHSCLMEVSSIGLDLARVDGIDFNVAAFTNFTQDHLDFHASMEQYFDAKSRLFKDLLSEQGTAVLNGDHSLINALSTNANTQWTFGQQPHVDWRLGAIRQSLTSTRCSVHYKNNTYELALPLVGVHNLENAIVAVCSAVSLGVPIESALDTLRHLPQVAGRVERIDTKTDWFAFVDYAHTPDALKRVLQTLRLLTSGELVVVFGCGGDRDTEKRPVMGNIASALADRVFVTSDNPRKEDPNRIIADISAGIDGEASYITDRKTAIHTAIQSLSSNDVLLVAGKGHETYQILKEETIHFDDREAILEGI